MESALLRILPTVPALAAVLGWLALRDGIHRRFSNALLWVAQGLVAAIVAYLSAVALPGVSELQDAVATWIGFGDVLVSIAFRVNQQSAFAMSAVWLATALALWKTRGVPGESALRIATMALQAVALATLMFDSLPTALAAWALVGMCCELCEGAVRLWADGWWHGRFVLHRLADVLGLLAIFSLFSVAPANTLSELQDANINDVALVGSLALVCLLGALAVRVVAVLWALQEQLRCALQAFVVVFCGAQVYWRVVGQLVVPDSQMAWRLALPAALLAGALCAWQLRVEGPLWRWGLAPLAVFSSLGARAVVGLGVSILDALFLQAPALVIDAGARVLRMLQGGDVQRYVGIGLIGLGALVYVTTRPAAAPQLSLRIDGLTVRVEAGRGAASAQRLEFDYDFDGDDVVDRRAAGPNAAYTYAVPGTYNVTVTVRDPFWHTQRRLRGSVKVQP